MTQNKNKQLSQKELIKIHCLQLHKLAHQLDRDYQKTLQLHFRGRATEGALGYAWVLRMRCISELHARHRDYLDLDSMENIKNTPKDEYMEKLKLAAMADE